MRKRLSGATCRERGRPRPRAGEQGKLAEDTHARLTSLSPLLEDDFCDNARPPRPESGSAPAWPAPASAPNLQFPSQPRAANRSRFLSLSRVHRRARDTNRQADIELKDFAAHVIEKFNVNKIEPWTGHFPSTDAEISGTISDVGGKGKGRRSRTSRWTANTAPTLRIAPSANRPSRSASSGWTRPSFSARPGIRTNIPAAKGVTAGPRSHCRKSGARGRVCVGEEHCRQPRE